MIYFYFQKAVTLLVILVVAVSNAVPYPGDGASRDDLIAYYFSLSYSSKEICGFLLCVHNIAITLRQLKRIKKRLKLKRYNLSSPIEDVIRHIRILYSQGFIDYGYKFFWRMLNRFSGINVTQETVRLALRALDPVGVSLRSGHRLRRRVYYNKGPNFLIHIDGYDKLKPYGIAIHGAIDGFSRKILWLKSGYSNNDPKLIASNYLRFIKKTLRVPRCIRADAGTENVIVRDLQIVLRSFHNDASSGPRSFITGRSPANQRIERFWGSLKSAFTQFWRNYFLDMVDTGILNVSDPVHLECLRFCFLPIIQNHLERFTFLWNSHRIRKQTQGDVMSDIPDVMYYQPEVFGTHSYSFELPCSLPTMDFLMNQYSREYPEFGCSEEFLQVIEMLLPLNRFDFFLERSVDEAYSLFRCITSRIEEL